MASKSLQIFERVIAVQVKRLNNGDYLATSRILPGLVAQGRTMAEALETAQDVARKLIESYLEHGDPLPAVLRRQLKQKSKTAKFLVPVAVNA